MRVGAFRVIHGLVRPSQYGAGSAIEPDAQNVTRPIAIDRVVVIEKTKDRVTGDHRTIQIPECGDANDLPLEILDEPDKVRHCLARADDVVDKEHTFPTHQIFDLGAIVGPVPLGVA